MSVKYIIFIIFAILLVYFLIKKDYIEGFQDINLKHNYLHLVLYSDDKEYNKMKKITEKYYNIFKNVKTIYYKFDNTIKEDYKLEDSLLRIKGNETYIPGILDKTIKAFEYVKDYEYDYLVRSNISTIVNFKLLDKKLTIKPVEYSGGQILNLQWLDEKGGIIDKTHFGLPFVAGTSIIFSKKIINKILQNKEKINYKLIDDVSIGLLMSNVLNKTAENIKNNNYIYVPNINGNKTQLRKIISDKPYIFYRNNNIDRTIDVKNMSFIVKYLLNKNN
jgi:hypothetical protein